MGRSRTDQQRRIGHRRSSSSCSSLTAGDGWVFWNRSPAAPAREGSPLTRKTGEGFPDGLENHPPSTIIFVVRGSEREQFGGGERTTLEPIDQRRNQRPLVLDQAFCLTLQRRPSIPPLPRWFVDSGARRSPLMRLPTRPRFPSAAGCRAQGHLSQSLASLPLVVINQGRLCRLENLDEVSADDAEEVVAGGRFQLQRIPREIGPGGEGGGEVGGEAVGAAVEGLAADLSGGRREDTFVQSFEPSSGGTVEEAPYPVPSQ